MENIVNISSDEEEDAGEISASCPDGAGKCDLGWISSLLDEVDRSPLDSDDVVVVGEVFSTTEQTLKSSVAVCEDPVKAVHEDEGDCIILEEDPDKPVDVNNGDGRDDELVVVSEKGQVACRDYPHPRHHCAKFPFASSPHESFCEQCHCYVCDSLAPCGQWGNGMSVIDHCHASEKDEFWKTERYKKKNKKLPSSLPLPAQLPLQNKTSLPQSVLCDMTQNQAFAGISAPIRPCSMQQGTLTPPPGFSVPSLPCSRQQETLSLPPGSFVPSRPPGFIVPRDNNNLHAQNVSHQFQNGVVIRCSSSRRWNAPHVGLGPQSIQSRTLFKRTGPVPQSVTAYRHGNSLSYVYNRPSFHRNPPGVPRPIDSHGWVSPPITNTCSPGSLLDPVPSQSQQSGYLSCLPSFPQGVSQSSNYANPVSSQPFLGRTYTDQVAHFQQYVDINSLGKAPEFINNIENPMHPRSIQAIYNNIPEMNFQSNAGNGSESSANPLHVGSSGGDERQLFYSSPHLLSQETMQNSTYQGSQIQNPNLDGTLSDPHVLESAEKPFFESEVNNQFAEDPFVFDDLFCEDAPLPPGMNPYSPDSSAHLGSWSLF